MNGTGRLKGITVFSWVIIVSSVLNFLFNLPAGSMNPRGSVLFYFLAAPFSIVVGIFLLKFKNWARVAIIVVSVLVGAETVISTPHVLAQLTAMDPNAVPVLKILMLLMICFSLVFNGAVIFYFTRPAVKVQFK